MDRGLDTRVPDSMAGLGPTENKYFHLKTRAGVMVQVVEHLPTKHKDLSSNLSTSKTKQNLKPDLGPIDRDV